MLNDEKQALLINVLPIQVHALGYITCQSCNIVA